MYHTLYAAADHNHVIKWSKVYCYNNMLDVFKL